MKKSKKLKLSRETLSPLELRAIAGGYSSQTAANCSLTQNCTASCCNCLTNAPTCTNTVRCTD